MNAGDMGAVSSRVSLVWLECKCTFSIQMEEMIELEKSPFGNHHHGKLMAESLTRNANFIVSKHLLIRLITAGFSPVQLHLWLCVCRPSDAK